MEFEDVLLKVGSYGKYQKQLFFAFLIPCVIVLPSAFFLNLFFLSVPEHWCYVPELELMNLTTEQEKEVKSLGIRTSCSTVDANYSSILSPDGNWVLPENATNRSCTDGWNYDQTNYEFTAATQWNMVCDKSDYPSFILALTTVGTIIGTPFFGLMSDRFGRKRTMFIMVFLFCVLTTGSVLTTNLIAFVVLRVINCGLTPTIFQLPIVLLLELVDSDMRSRVNSVANIFWTAGMCLLPLIAWLSGNWITLGISVSLIVAFIFFCWPIVPESPRWLITQGKYDEATKVMLKIAKKNGKNVQSEEILVLLQKIGEGVENKANNAINVSPFVFLKRSQLRKKFLIVTYGWIATSIAYFGLQMNGYNLVGNEFVNFVILGIAELPGYFCGWLFMEKIGRRWCTVSALTLVGLTCLVPVMYKNDTANVVASFIAKFAASMTFIVVYQQGSELYPTPVRSIGISLSSTFVSIAVTGLPFLIFSLVKYGELIPFVVMAFFSLTAAFATSFLPETLHENLPQTLADAEKIGLVHNYFSCSGRKSSTT